MTDSTLRLISPNIIPESIYWFYWYKAACSHSRDFKM